MTRVNHTAFRFAIALCGLLFALPLGMKALPIAPPPETPEVFLQRIGPALERDTIIAKTNEQLKGIILPKLELRDATVENAAEYLNNILRECNSSPGAFQIPLVRIRNYPVIMEAGSAAPLPTPPPADLTLSLSNITFPEALRYIISISGRLVDIEPDGIWLKPVSYGTTYLEKHIYIIPATVYATKADVEKMLGTKFHDYDPKSGMTYWDFDEKSHLLTVQDGDINFEKFEIRYARELLKHGFRPAGAQGK